MMKLGTFCSGIGAPEVAARGLFDPIWFSEIEPFPCAVLSHHWPEVPNLGDMTAPDLVQRIAKIGLPDVVVAGLPCQPFSVAGLRKGEADPRNLTARFVEIADAIDDLRRDAGKSPVWWLVENVPGLLNDRGNAFGALLGGMVGSSSAIVPNGRWECAGVATGPRRSAAWRVLDAQFFGVAQRRRRVFAIFVAGPGSLRCADALLPIIDSMSWHSPPSREAGQRPAPTISARTKGGGGLGTDFDCDGGLIARVADPLTVGANQYSSFPGEPVEMIASTGDGVSIGYSPTLDKSKTPGVAYAIQERAVSGNPAAGPDGAGFRQDDAAYTLEARPVTQAVAFDLNQITSKANRSQPDPAVHHTLPATACPPHLAEPVAFDLRGREGGAMPEGPHDTANIRAASGGSSRSYIAQPWAVRRLMPVETARLQGFPDDHTAITYRGKPAADGPQYKAHGNSMAVPVIAYILERMHISMTGQAPQTAAHGQVAAIR